MRERWDWAAVEKRSMVMIPGSSHWVASATAVSSSQSSQSSSRDLGRLGCWLGGEGWQRWGDGGVSTTKQQRVPGTGGDGAS